MHPGKWPLGSSRPVVGNFGPAGSARNLRETPPCRPIPRLVDGAADSVPSPTCKSHWVAVWIRQLNILSIFVWAGAVGRLSVIGSYHASRVARPRICTWQVTYSSVLISVDPRPIRVHTVWWLLQYRITLKRDQEDCMIQAHLDTSQDYLQSQVVVLITGSRSHLRGIDSPCSIIHVESWIGVAEGCVCGYLQGWIWTPGIVDLTCALFVPPWMYRGGDFSRWAVGWCRPDPCMVRSSAGRCSPGCSYGGTRDRIRIWVSFINRYDTMGKFYEQIR